MIQGTKDTLAQALADAMSEFVEIAPGQLVNRTYHARHKNHIAPLQPVDETTRAYWAELRKRHP